MPTKLEELVEFISHGNTPIRQTAVEYLVPYSTTQPAIFKTNQYVPLNDLKLLVRDYDQIAKNAITILINLSTDREILENLAADKEFVKTLVGCLTKKKEPNADLITMLLANMTKHDDLKSLLTLECPNAPADLQSNTVAINQLMDLFVRGASGAYNTTANYDYLAYIFADLAKHAEGRKYLVTRQIYDEVIPLSKLVVFTEHSSTIRRKGVASTIKNVTFETTAHVALLDADDINILPYILLPLTGNEEYDDEDTAGMLEDLQLLPPDKTRDPDPAILHTHIETLTLLTTTRPGRDTLRQIKTYPIVRETHLRVEDDDLREACERLVQVLMRDEEGKGEGQQNEMKALSHVSSSGAAGARQADSGGAGYTHSSGMVQELREDEDEDDEDDQITEV